MTDFDMPPFAINRTTGETGLNVREKPFLTLCQLIW